MFAIGLWLTVTVTSTAMVWTATSIVAADVTDRPASVLAHHEVVSELESGSPAPQTAPTSTTTKAGGSTSTVPSPGRRQVPASPSPPAPAPAGPSTRATPAPGALPGARPASPAPPQPPPRPTATYSTSGGVVRVACSGYFIELISAIPSNGYAVNVVAGGPANVEVHFLGFGQDVSVKAVCFGQPIRYYDQTPPRQASG